MRIIRIFVDKCPVKGVLVFLINPFYYLHEKQIFYFAGGDDDVLRRIPGCGCH